MHDYWLARDRDDEGGQGTLCLYVEKPEKGFDGDGNEEEGVWDAYLDYDDISGSLERLLGLSWVTWENSPVRIHIAVGSELE